MNNKIQQFLNSLKTLNKHKIPTQTNKSDLLKTINSEQTLKKIYNIPDSGLPELFQSQLQAVGGQAFLCSNSQELKNQLKQLFISKHWQYPFTFDSQIKNILSELNIKFFDSYDNFQKIDVGLNTCEFLAAWTGSVLVSSALPGGRQLNVFSPELIFICNKNQLVLDPGQALIKLKQKYNNNLPSQFSFITGPSKTADIEKTLIYGMHGAKKVYVFILL